MCLILLAWKLRADFPLVVAANRDEFHSRATAAAAAWPDAPGVFGGRDLEAGGTWLGVAAGGRFAAVTNVREAGSRPGQRSRGHLAADFLRGDLDAAAYAAQVADCGGDTFAGFNLLVGDGSALYYVSNRAAGARCLPPGIYGVSNHLLDTPWPKLASAKADFAAALSALPDEQAFFTLLSDREIVADERLPATGVPLLWERLLSAVFVCSADYGTRASTLLLIGADGGGRLVERSFAADGAPVGEVRLQAPPRR